MLKRICFGFLIVPSLAAPVAAQYAELGKQIAPTGWQAKEDSSGGMLLNSADGKSQIMLAAFENDPTRDLGSMTTSILQSETIKDCPKDLKAIAQSARNGNYFHAQVANATRQCSVVTGRRNKTIFVLLGSGPLTEKVADKSLEIADKLIGITANTAPAMTAATQPAISNSANKSATLGTAKLGSKPVTGYQGVWVNLGTRTVYDPVTAVRLEYGINYLVLTDSGYFANEVPWRGAFNDEGMERLIQKSKFNGGRYTVNGNQITLNYASGKVETATQRKLGASWIITLDDAEYTPKRMFPDGATLSGIYSNSSVTRISEGTFASGESDMVFSADGRFAKRGNSSVSAVNFSIVGGDERQSGTYFINDSAIHLNYGDGTTEIMSMWQEKPNDAIWFNGDMFKVAGDK